VGTRVGLIDEWHLDFAKTFEHFPFYLPSWLCQAVVVFRFSFRHSRLETVGAVCDAVDGDGPEHLLVECFSMEKSTVRAKQNNATVVARSSKRAQDHLARTVEANGQSIAGAAADQQHGPPLGEAQAVPPVDPGSGVQPLPAR
jgi:hypothetical protein